MSTRYYPEKFNIITTADDVGLLVDVERLVGESLFDYKKRVLESNIKKTNSSHSGLVNAINQELGLKQLEAIEIGLKEILTSKLTNEGITESNDDINRNFIVTDNRLYEGVITSGSVTISQDQLTFSTNKWAVNDLIGLSLEVNGIDYLVTSNTENQIFVNKNFQPKDETTSLAQSFINSPYKIRANWKINSYIGYSFILEKNTYIILANTSNTISLNKRIKYATDGFFKLQLTKPRVHLTSARLILYMQYTNEKNNNIEMQIDLREKGITHRSLCKKINTESKYFNAMDLIPLSRELSAFTLTEKDSDVMVLDEEIPSSKFFKLKNRNIKPDTLKFSETYSLFKEEDDLENITFGPYYSVNYSEGAIKTVKIPSGEGVVSYSYANFPLVIMTSPAVIINLADKETENFLFTQNEKVIYEDPKDRFVPSQPKAEMIEYISELLKVNRQSWGV